MELGTSLTAIDTNGHGLRVTFVKRGDRWHHVIDRIDGDQATRLLESLEGDASDAWPVSPPFQELSRETLPDGREVLFLVGRAGTSHWSASVEAIDDPPHLIFDIACRHGQTPERLGSEYRTSDERAEIEPIGASTRIEHTDAKARVVATLAATRLPSTAQWKYSIR